MSKQFPTDEELRKTLKHRIAIGAVVDSGYRSEDGSVRWTLNRTHPYWADIWEELNAE
jgi:hypothetical protein